MKPWRTLARDGALVLQERDGERVIRSGGVELMSSRRRASEEAMAGYAAGAARVLVGGLGLGATLRAVLEQRGVREVVVAELSPTVVEWNRSVLGLSALGEPRVKVHLGDVAQVPGLFDAVLLDVDNGPFALPATPNAGLYTAAGVARFRAMLPPQGVLVVWSAGHDARFLKTLRRGGFDAVERPVAGAVLFVATAEPTAPGPGGARGRAGRRRR